MAIFSEFKFPDCSFATPPIDAAFLLRICSAEDFAFVREKLGPARERRLRWIRLRIFHSAMMILSRHISCVASEDWSSNGLAAGQIVLARWRARLSWTATYARGVVQIAGVPSIGVRPSALRVYDALATITGQIR